MSDLRELVAKFENLAQNCLCRHKSNSVYADEILHTKDTYEDLLKFCKLAAALASQPSAVFGPEPPLAAKLGETKFSDRWGRQWLFVDASNSLGNVLKAAPEGLGVIKREEIIAAPSGPKETSVGDLKAKLESLRDEWRVFADTDYTKGQKLGDAKKQGQYELMMAGQSIAYATAAERLTAIIEGKD